MQPPEVGEVFEAREAGGGGPRHRLVVRVSDAPRSRATAWSLAPVARRSGEKCGLPDGSDTGLLVGRDQLGEEVFLYVGDPKPDLLQHLRPVSSQKLGHVPWLKELQID
jgi:hypothetical protein